MKQMLSAGRPVPVFAAAFFFFLGIAVGTRAGERGGRRVSVRESCGRGRFAGNFQRCGAPARSLLPARRGGRDPVADWFVFAGCPGRGACLRPAGIFRGVFDFSDDASRRNGRDCPVCRLSVSAVPLLPAGFLDPARLGVFREEKDARGGVSDSAFSHGAGRGGGAFPVPPDRSFCARLLLRRIPYASGRRDISGRRHVSGRQHGSGRQDMSEWQPCIRAAGCTGAM